MIKPFFKLLTGNFIGKIIGFLREVIIAALYGVSAPVGALRIAQTIILMPINFFTSDSLNAGFIPLYNRYKLENFKKAQSLFWILKIIFIFLSILLLILLFYFAPIWVKIIAPGFNETQFDLAVSFVRIMSISIPFYVISSLYSYVAIANQSYFLASIRPTIQSLGMILGAIFSYEYGNIVFLAWGFTSSYICFFLLGIINLKEKGLLVFSLEKIKEILIDFWKTIKPLLFLPLILQGNIVIERIISSLMGIKVVAAVEYAKFITETGVVLLAIPLGLVGLSTFSHLNIQEVKKKLLQIVPLILIITIPISLFLALYSNLIIVIIFKRGFFSQEAVFLTQKIFIGLSIGFWAQISAYFLIKILNAQRRNKEVLIFMSLALSINSLFNIFFYKILGPITIGIGTTLYGIILFLLTINAFRIKNKTLSVLLFMLFGSIIYYLLYEFVFNEKPIISIMFYILYWIIYIMIIPNLRYYLIHIFLFLKK